MNQKQYHSSYQRGPHRSSNHEDQTSRTLYVKINKSRLPNADLSVITNKHFRKHFEEFEDYIERSNVIFHHDTGLPKGFGFVTFESRNAASDAMEYFQGSMLGGRHRLDISFKKQKEAVSSGPHPNPSIGENATAAVYTAPVASKKQAGSHPNPRVRTAAVSTAPTACKKRNDTIIEFKDKVIGLMMTEGDNQSLRAVASKEQVELCPLPAPRVGFQMKGKLKGIEVVRNYCDQLRVTREQNNIGYEQIVLNVSRQPIYASFEVEQFKRGLEKDLKVVAISTFQECVCHQAGLRVAQHHVTFVRIVVGDLLTQLTDAIVIPTGRAVDAKHSYPIELPSLPCGNRSLENTSEPLEEVGQIESLNGGEFPCSYIIQALFPLAIQKLADNESCDLVIRNSLSLAARMNLGSITFPGIKTQMVKSIFDCLYSLGPTSLHTVTVVLGTKFEAKRYEVALRSITSSNAELKTERSFSKAVNQVSSTNTLLVGSSGFNWSWREDDGSFIPYTSAATEALNQSYQQDRNGQCHLAIGGARYTVIFTPMKQINMSTHKLRDVRRSINSTNGSNTGLNPGSQTPIPWKYRDDFGRFMSYSPADSAKIEAMFQKQDESGCIVILQRTYKFNFNTMKQVNVSTGYSRDIQHAVPSTPDDDQVVRSKPIFLPEDEMLINMKGPRENLAAAKKQLEQKMTAILFTKNVPLPTKLTPSLHQHLQVIAKKNQISYTTGGEGTASEASQQVLTLEGLESHVKGALTEVHELILQFQASSEQLGRSAIQGSQYPEEWEPMSENDFVKLVHLPMLPECRRVSQKFQETMPGAYIIKVQRVQNKELWRRYMQCMSRLHEKNAGKVNEKLLFHGTRGEPAEKICKSEEGFDMRFSREGMWGQANYFAVNAGYSDIYSHQDTANGNREMILAKVLTGDSYYFSRSDSTLRMPPEKPRHSAGANQLQQVRYDSVNGKTSGSVVYMTYSNDRAYPAYIITYSRTQPAGYSHPATALSHVPASPSAASRPSQASAYPQQQQSQAPTLPPSQARQPLVTSAKQIAASVVSRVAQIRESSSDSSNNNGASKDKCTIS